MGSQRGLASRIERKLESTVGDAFARVFGGSIVPQEIEALLRREAEDGLRPLHGNRLLVPNEYVITLGVHDFEKVSADPDLTSSAFGRDLADYLHEQGWETYGDVVVRFEQLPNLHIGQFRARGAVNPDVEPAVEPHVEPRPMVNNPAPPQSNQAFSAEPGVPPMTDNPSYRGQGQGRPGDEYYDERYGRPQDDQRAGQEPQGGPDPRGGFPPEQGGYPPQGGYQPPRHPDQGGYQDQRGGYPEQGGYPPQGGYPGPGGYQDPGRGYPDQGQGGYPPSYEQRPPGGAGGYGGPGYDQAGYDQGYRQGGYGQPGGGQPPAAGPQAYGGYGEYGRGPARPEEGGYAPPPTPSAPEQQRPSYPEQPGGYDQGYPQGGQGYAGQQEYGGGDYTQYAENVPAGGYGPQGGAGYPETAHRDYEYGQQGEYGQQPDYGQPAGGGYAGYGQGGYGSAGTAVTLQLDDGSGRTYQLRDGSNIVGRGQDAQFRLPDTGVSRRHLEIRWDGQVALLSDLNSTNGTTVNNAPVQEWQLADGDVIRLGHSEIIVRIH